MRLFYQEHKNIARGNGTFLELVREGLTREELAVCIQRNPSLWGRFAGFLKTLPGREAGMNQETIWKNRLKELIKDCSSVLRRNATELRDLGESRAADMSLAMADVSDALVELSVVQPLTDRSCLLTGANVHALQQGNGLGDCIIWPAYRRAGMHQRAEEWTTLTNLVRETSNQ
jgi:hypothetical protein